MKVILLTLSILFSLTALASTPYEFSYKDHCETKAVVMDEILIQDLMLIMGHLERPERMVAGERETLKADRKGGWDSGLRERLQGVGSLTRL